MGQLINWIYSKLNPPILIDNKPTRPIKIVRISSLNGSSVIKFYPYANTNYMQYVGVKKIYNATWNGYNPDSSDVHMLITENYEESIYMAKYHVFTAYFPYEEYKDLVYYLIKRDTGDYYYEYK